ncbi:MAG: helix-turn-helix transcriptional regulator [Longimicrobiales bacterium]|nr:helix-turn-helix transcriptional regulator [Longimicrobiales bacterium]
MGGDGLLGAFEEQVLLSVARGQGESYGMQVRRDIEARTDRDVSIGAVYATLNRLEKKGLVVSSLRDGPPERRGRAQRFFSLEPSGAEALRTSLEQHRSMWEGLDPDALLGDGSA